MLLIFDIGNTNVKVALFESDQLLFISINHTPSTDYTLLQNMH